MEETVIDIEEGESSNLEDVLFVCEICTNTKTMSDVFYISGCHHAYCSDCIAMYIGSKLEENITNIMCPVPGCSGSLKLDFCRSILPAEVSERWGKALCETSIDVSEKFYCPFADCSALLINGETKPDKNSECPNCNRMLCAQCKVPWHEGIKCGEFKKLNADERGREDAMLRKLAKDNRWSRCPKCRFYVIKSEGCNFMTCRCGCNFCYKCGGLLVPGGCNCYYYLRQQQEEVIRLRRQEEVIRLHQQQEVICAPAGNCLWRFYNAVGNYLWRFFDNAVVKYLACCCCVTLILGILGFFLWPSWTINS